MFTPETALLFDSLLNILHFCVYEEEYLVSPNLYSCPFHECAASLIFFEKSFHSGMKLMILSALFNVKNINSLGRKGRNSTIQSLCELISLQWRFCSGWWFLFIHISTDCLLWSFSEQSLLLSLGTDKSSPGSTVRLTVSLNCIIKCEVIIS